ncbi:phage tail tape measure protein [Acinetobacter guerrae]|uniref:Phage tail tape measure protein n=1 Tax=Acinetobacter guerrae TaxID=1843371 RepID=A0A3A8EY59_9GAMM|nr:phage tail tape measure protein [Acinetobacter guerrae]RKG33383.1 phage tail tape measure protein [Acinetobacter guerrae]
MANKKLNAVITIGGALAGSFRTVIGSTTKELGKIGTEINKVKQNQRQLGEAIRTFGGMGKNVDNLRSKYSLVTAELKKLETQQLRLSNVEKQRIANNNRLSEIKGQIGSTIATGLTLAAPIKTAIDFETAMLGVAKQLDGARDSAGNLTKDFFNMQKEILTVADNSPVARNEIAEMVSAGLRMGVAKDEVVGFTQEVIKMGTAFELPMGQLADDMGKIGNMYKIPMTQIGKLADTINYLDDNSLSKGGDIIDFMQRVGGTASMVKITDKNTAALGSTLLSLGEKSETASTAVNAVFSKLGAANTGSKSFKAMVKEIGLSTVELEKGMQTNATETIFKVMDAIKKLPKEASMEKLWVPPKMSKDGKKQLKAGYYAETPATTQIDAVSTLFGAEHWDTFSKLLENRGEFEKQIGMANSKNAEGSMDKEYQARMKTTQAQIDMFKNRIGHLGVEFGSVLLPVINDVLGSVGSFATKIAEWTQKNPVLTGTIVKTVAALGVLKIGLLAAKFAIFAIRSPLISLIGGFARLGSSFNILKSGFMLVSKSASGFGKIIGWAWRIASSGITKLIPLATTVGRVLFSIGPMAVSGFMKILPVITTIGRALLFTPWGLVATVLVGAAILIYKNWDTIKKFFLDFVTSTREKFNQFGDAMGKVWDGIKQKVQPVIDLFKWLKDSGGEILSSIGGAIGKAYEKAKTVFGSNQSYSTNNQNLPPKQIPMTSPTAMRVNSNFLGSTVRERNSSDGLQNSPKQVAPPPPIRPVSNQQKAPQQTNHITQSFTVNALPGQSPQQIAQEVMRIQKQAQGVQQRSLMVDWGYSQ